MIILLQVSLKKISRTAFLRVDKQSGFNLLQAAVFEGMYDIVLEASGLLDNFVEEMKLSERERTPNNFKAVLQLASCPFQNTDFLVIVIIVISN